MIHELSADDVDIEVIADEAGEFFSFLNVDSSKYSTTVRNERNEDVD